jgi:hypothetical protein
LERRPPLSAPPWVSDPWKLGRDLPSTVGTIVDTQEKFSELSYLFFGYPTLYMGQSLVFCSPRWTDISCIWRLGQCQVFKAWFEVLVMAAGAISADPAWAGESIGILNGSLKGTFRDFRGRKSK